MSAITRSDRWTRNGISENVARYLEVRLDSGDGRNPAQVGGDAGESSGESNLATQRRSEGDNTDLVEHAIGRDIAQWATAVTVARSMAVRGTDANVVSGNDGAVNVGAGSVGDDGRVGLAQNRADATGAFLKFFKKMIMMNYHLKTSCNLLSAGLPHPLRVARVLT